MSLKAASIGAVAATVPTGLGFLAGLPLWRKRQTAVGNAVAWGVAFIAIITLMGFGYVAERRVYEACLATGTVCPRDPYFFVPSFACAIIAFVDVIMLAVVSQAIESRLKSRDVGVGEWPSS